MAFAPFSARSFFRDPLGFVRSEPDDRPLTHFAAGPSRYVLVRDPAVAWSVLVTDGGAFAPGKWKRRARRVVGDALNTLHGAEHRERRLLLATALGSRRIAAHAGAIAARASAALDGWPARTPFVLRDELDPLCLELAADVLVGVDLAPGSRELAAVLREVMAAVPRWRPPVWPTAGGRALARADAAIGALLDERRQTKAEDDMLGVLLGAGLPDRVVRGEVLAFLLAAVDEPPSVLEAAVWLLGRHPDTERCLHAELETVIGDRPVPSGDLTDLPQLDAVLAETLRLLPPARHIDRCPIEDRMLAGTRVRRGTNVLVSPLVLHNDPGLQPDAGAFAPGRWGADARRPRSNSAARGAYMPFGAGVHACIGEPLARLVMAVTLASIVRRGRLEADPGAPAPVPGAPRLTVRLEPW